MQHFAAIADEEPIRGRKSPLSGILYINQYVFCSFLSLCCKLFLLLSSESQVFRTFVVIPRSLIEAIAFLGRCPEPVTADVEVPVGVGAVGLMVVLS